MTSALHGFDDVVQALKGEAVPIYKAHIYKTCGGLSLGEGKNRVEVRELLDRLPADSFDTAEEACAALHEVACNTLPTDAADAAVDEIGHLNT